MVANFTMMSSSACSLEILDKKPRLILTQLQIQIWTSICLPFLHVWWKMYKTEKQMKEISLRLKENQITFVVQVLRLSMIHPWCSPLHVLLCFPTNLNFSCKVFMRSFPPRFFPDGYHSRAVRLLCCSLALTSSSLTQLGEGYSDESGSAPTSAFFLFFSFYLFFTSTCYCSLSALCVRWLKRESKSSILFYVDNLFFLFQKVKTWVLNQWSF